MQTLRCVRRRHDTPLFFSTTATATSGADTSSSTTTSTTVQNFSISSSSPTPPAIALNETSNDIVSSFRERLLSRKDQFLEQIFEILRAQDGVSAAADASLRRLSLRVTEPLVLEVLNYQKPRPELSSCLKFFDWAGRQPGFYHTQATFNAIFKIISKAKLRPLILEYLVKQRYINKITFYNTLIIGYSVAGRPDFALQMLSRMRFKRLDLDPFGYNVLLNALIEEGHFDAAEAVAKQIKFRGHESAITHSIVVKGYCKRRELDRAEEYLQGLVGEERSGLNGIAIGVLVDALCKEKQFERAGMIVEDFRKLNIVFMEYAYGVWIRNLIKMGKLDGALELLKDKNLLYRYVPDVFRYNTLICRLLKENRLEEVSGLLKEMKEHDILPDEVTMNATLCYFCKKGMVDSAVELYNSRKELGFFVNGTAYKYLINTLVGDGRVDEAHEVFTTAIEQHYYVGKETLNNVAEALYKEGKLDKLMELLLVSFDKNLVLKGSTYAKFISELCKARRVVDNQARRVEDGYLLPGDLSRLLIGMQEKGHVANRKLFRSVICCLCETNNPEEQFFKLLDKQLSRFGPSCIVFNYFIDGAGHAKRPELARKVYEMMGKYGIKPTLESDILLLQSFLKSEKIFYANEFFQDMSEERKASKSIWHAMIVGLAKGIRLDEALKIFWEMRAKQMKPSLECYEELVKLLCAKRSGECIAEKIAKRGLVFKLIEDLIQTGRRVSPFIGNLLLLNCLYNQYVYLDWEKSKLRDMQPNLTLVIAAFSGRLEGSQDIEHMEELIRQCFVPDIFTQNILLRRLIKTNGVDDAFEYLNNLPRKGFEPNRWTYNTLLVLGYLKRERYSDARKLMEIMEKRGFDLTQATKKYIGSMEKKGYTGFSM